MAKEKIRPKDGYWIIPPEIYDPLNKEFKFDFDPAPNPRPKAFDGLEVDWKRSNWVNPPFWAGITAWVRKAIEEKHKGNSSVLILPLDNWVNLLIKEGVEIRNIGFHEWIHTKDGSRRKAPRPSFLFILKGGAGTVGSAEERIKELEERREHWFNKWNELADKNRELEAQLRREEGLLASKQDALDKMSDQAYEWKSKAQKKLPKDAHWVDADKPEFTKEEAELICGNKRPARKTMCQLDKGHIGSCRAVIFWEEQ